MPAHAVSGVPSSGARPRHRQDHHTTRPHPSSRGGLEQHGKKPITRIALAPRAAIECAAPRRNVRALPGGRTAAARGRGHDQQHQPGQRTPTVAHRNPTRPQPAMNVVRAIDHPADGVGGPSARRIGVHCPTPASIPISVACRQKLARPTASNPTDRIGPRRRRAATSGAVPTMITAAAIPTGGDPHRADGTDQRLRCLDIARSGKQHPRRPGVTHGPLAGWPHCNSRDAAADQTGMRPRTPRNTEKSDPRDLGRVRRDETWQYPQIAVSTILPTRATPARGNQPGRCAHINPNGGTGREQPGVPQRTQRHLGVVGGGQASEVVRVQRCRTGSG